MKRLVQLLITLLFAATSMWVQAIDGPITTIGNTIVIAPASVSIPVTVTNFNNVGSLSLKLNYNASILTYTGYTVAALSGITAATPSSGVVTMGWYGIPGQTLSDGSILIKLNFNVTNSGTSALTWNDGGNACEYADYPGYVAFNDSPTANFYINGSVASYGKIDIGIYNTACGDFEVRCKSVLGIPGNYLTDILFAVKWPVTSPNASLINASSPVLFGIAQQGSTAQSGGYNYATFVATPLSALLNWTAGTEYTVLTFSHNKGGVGTGDFVIGNDTWTTANNANYFTELSGLDNTGDIYASATGVDLGTAVADDPADVTACDSYTLPALINGNYFTGAGGTGTALFADDEITSTQTIYVYTPAIAPCVAAENSFLVTINTTPVADDPADVTACDSYTLPALINGNYFTGAGGTGTALFADDEITSTQTIYVYTPAIAPCVAAENSFLVTINTTPVADDPADVTACDSYTLPALINGNYFTGAGGTGTALFADDEITSTQTIYVYTPAIAPCVAAENSFLVTINTTPVADDPADVTACDSYTLPALINGNYFTGAGGTGTALFADDEITSTQTIYVYTPAIAPCVAAENSFLVTINTTPVADDPADVTACDSYTLPALINGNYFTGAGGTGTALFADDEITSTQTIYVYTPAIAPCVAAENSFLVTINTTPVADDPADVTACDSYTLPALINGNYFTGAGGTGTALFADDEITSTQTIYVYTPAIAPCVAAENSFLVTINTTPVADDPADVTACDSYTLPALINGNYFTGAGGTGTALFADDEITSTQTIYVYTPAIAPCVAAENSFLVTINTTPVADDPADVTACDSYTLPALINGNYFTGAGGTGTALFADDEITSTQTIYVYTPAIAPCVAAENSFLVTINTTPVADDPADVTACDSYTLPALINGNYFTGAGGTGTALFADDEITSTQTIYVYTPAIAPCVAAENSFLVTINTTPVADDPADVTACDSYTLPALINGNYFTGAGGTGTALFADDEITSTQTIYVYTPAIAPCVAAENSFLVTINTTPVADDPADVTACDSYTLPALINGNYFTGAGGTGTALFADDEITSTQTIYVYTPAIAPCVAAENSFLVTINTTPVADDPADVTACDSYTLPALINGNYFTGAGGTGTALFADDEITSTQTIYVYTPAIAPCVAAENSFLVTINTTPVADDPADVTACDSYTLPALINGNYFTGAGGTGTALFADDEITSTQTIYVYTPAIAPCVAAENSFLVTINTTPVADDPADVTACDSYTLPALINGNYFTGAGGTGTALFADDEITSTQTIYVYTPAIAPCVAAENSFLVTINTTPVADDPADVTACDSYTLPALINGNYFTGAGGTGTALFADDEITSTQTIYVYTPAIAPCVAAENSFLVTINTTPVADDPADVTACDSYTLPALINGNYFTGAGGTGTALFADDEITSTQTIYVYTPAIAPCVAAENSFLVTINTTPVADDPADVTACDSYTLPALINGNYFTGAGGTGTALFADDEITSTQTIYVYTPAIAPCVAAENSFLVTINTTPVADDPADVTACDSYTLPALINGNYFTGAGGTGTALFADDEITSTQTIYVYTPAIAPCVAAENSFLVTINTTPVADDPADVTACDSYTLPALINGNYFTGAGGTGTALFADDEITSTQTIYVYTPAIAPCVAAENSFLVTINTTPVADDPADVTACDSYTLPALINGNYFTGAGGTGTALFADDEITSTQTIYVYTPAIAPCVAAENSFLVTINTTPVADDPADVTACDSYTLPALINGNYFTGAGGTGTALFADDEITSTQTIYVYTPAIAPCVAAENSFLVTINTTPVADDPADVTACDSYTLPALINGNYFTGAGGTGTALFADDEITSTQTIYVYTPAIAPCVAAENSFLVTINTTPVADDPADVTACDSYTLPALINGNYFTGAGGTGTALFADDEITSTQTIYVYTPAIAPCVAAENSFLVTINTTPVADDPADVTACDSYTLPALINGNYFTGAGGTGTALFADDEITSTQTIYVYTPAIAPCVAAENSFLVTINTTPVADDPADVTACDSYTLPALINGNYFTGAGGTGTALFADDEITSTQTIYVYTPAIAPCVAAENSFLVTINTTPVADDPADVTACDSYTLPALINGNYFTGAGGTGTALFADDEITSTQTIYVYTPAIAPCVAAENSFLVTINTTPVADDPADVTACDSYTLPALINGNYFTGAGGTGTALFADDEITSTQTIYVYTPAIAPCVAAENSFLVTINTTPVADDPADVTACDSYTLPALINGNYFTGAGGTGTALFADDEITSTQTIYVYTPAIAPCVAAENSFLVTINTTPVADDPADVTACDSYTLPALINGNYFTGAGGTGTALFADDEITSTQTIYVYTPAIAPCVAAENSFLVTINTTPVADDPADVTACDSYTLPALINGNYFTGAGGTGTALFADDEITSTQTIYVYTPAIAPCVAAENSFLVTINTTPVADDPADVTACDSYTLPALINGNYFTGAGGTGTALFADDEITSTQTIYVYTPAIAPCVAAENSFLVTINTTPVADDPADVTACDSYTLPALINGNYFTGAGGTGTALFADDEITSTQTIYVYTPAIAPCVAAENSFLVTINTTPVADDPADVTACDSYTLPALINGNYFTGAGGTGTALFADDEITSTQTIYVYTPAIAPCVAAENSFLVTINTTPVADDPADVTACDSYTLPALINGNYFTGAGGTGTALFADDEITSTQTIYVYTPAIAPCVAAENSFLVTINTTPVADDPADVTACDSYTLPALINGNYFTGAGGTGTALFADDEITSTQTIYVYTPAIAPCVAAENSFLVTINTTPVADDPADVTACDSYTLPALINGNYFTGAGGTGTALFADDEITSTQTIYVYTPAIAPCVAAENSFLVTINTTPVADDPADVTACDSYTLPALINGNYFTGAGGTGTALFADDEITSTQTIYVYTPAIAPCVAAENSFLVTINTTPVADDPADVTACDSYTLPALINGNYFTGAGGTGTALFADDEITSTQTIYVYTPAIAPCVAAENSFLVTINTTPVADDPADVLAYGSYTLPALTVGDYYTATGGPGGTGTKLLAGALVTSTTTLYVYAETGTTPNCWAENSFVVTINPAYELTLTVFLQGPYSAGQMSMALNGYLPSGQPFGGAPWNYPGTETLPSPLSADVVDWVLVELRSDLNTMVERKAGLLYKNGTVAVSFSGSTPGGTYVVVWARNHMPVMSISKVTLPIEGASYNLTSLANLYGTNPAINVGGVYCMIAGDVTKNGMLKYSGANNDRGPIIARIVAETGSNNINGVTGPGYWQEDVNLNSIVKYLGEVNDRGIIQANLNTLTGFPYLNNTYTSVVPGAYFGGKDGSNDGPVDIHFTETVADLSIEMVTNELIENGMVDNIQFTLAWKASDTEIEQLLNTFASDFDLMPQGDAVTLNGIKYLVYVSITPGYLPEVWNSGETVAVMTFEKEYGQLINDRLWIADNDFTGSNNGDYFVSNWGSDVTGIIYTSTVGIGRMEAGEMKLYPNPVQSNNLFVQLVTDPNVDLQVEIRDMTGNLIRTLELKTVDGTTTFTIDVTQFYSGVYLINVIGDKVHFTDRFIVK